MDLSSAAITLRAGSGAGLAAAVDAITNAPTFRGAAGGATSPTSFTLRQDAALADAAIPAAGQFAGGLAGLDYTLRSDGGSVTLDTAAKVAASALTLAGVARRALSSARTSPWPR